MSSQNLLEKEDAGQYFDFGTVDGAALSSLVNETFLNRQGGQSSEIVHAEFLHKGGPVFFNRLGTDIKQFRSLSVLVTLREELHDLPFSLGQDFPTGSIPRRFLALQKTTYDHTCNTRAEIVATVQNEPDGRQEFSAESDL